MQFPKASPTKPRKNRQDGKITEESADGNPPRIQFQMKKIKKLLIGIKNRLLLKFPALQLKDLPPVWRYWQLLSLVRILRSPHGCPWDRKQTFLSSYPYLREEFSELWRAIEELTQSPDRKESLEKVAEEAGDLLFSTAFVLSLLRDERGLQLSKPLEILLKKMVRRHPHVFSTASSDGAGTPAKWEELKRAEKGRSEKPDSILAKVKPDLSPLREADQISRAAASIGFDWPDVASVLEKVREELNELESEITDGSTTSEGRKRRIESELGDLLFALVNLARHLGVDPERALLSTIERFKSRFNFIEETLRRENRSPSETPLEELENLWQKAKKNDEPIPK